MWLPEKARARLRLSLIDHLEIFCLKTKVAPDGRDVELYEVTREEYLGMRFFLELEFDYMDLDIQMMDNTTFLGLFYLRAVFLINDRKAVEVTHEDQTC